MSVEASLNADFVDLLQCLTAENVEFLIGGAHGLPRATGDLDVFVRPTMENGARVELALRKFGAPLDVHRVSAELFL